MGFGLVIHSLQLEKTFCRSRSLLLLALKHPHSRAAAEVICLLRRTVNCLHPRTGKTGPVVTRTASYHGLQNICGHDHSLGQSWARCASLGLLILGTPSRGFSLCASPTGAIRLQQERENWLRSPKMWHLLTDMHQQQPLLGTRSKSGLSWWALEVSKLSLYL